MSKKYEATEEERRQVWKLSMLQSDDIPEYAIIGCIFINSENGERQFNYRTFPNTGDVDLEDMIDLLQSMAASMIESTHTT